MITDNVGFTSTIAPPGEWVSVEESLPENTGRNTWTRRPATMTREEATDILKESKRQNEVMRDNPSTFWASHQMAAGVNNAKRRIEALDVSLSALRPVSREQVEKVWKSEWIDNGERDPNGVPKTFAISCKRCGSSAGTSWMRFCPACGAPMTDEAVQMVMERLEALKDVKR